MNNTDISKKYYLLNSIKIVFKVDFISSFLILLLKMIVAIIPTIQLVIVAKFLDYSVAVANKQKDIKEVMYLLIIMVLLLSSQWICRLIIQLMSERLELNIRKKFKSELIYKQASIKYKYMENLEKRDLIFRVTKDSEYKIKAAYIDLLDFIQLILRIFGIILILTIEVWWTGIFIVAISIPCFKIAIKSGQEGYDAEKEVSKINRINEYYKCILQNRDSSVERNIFRYENEISSRYKEQYEFSRKYKTKVKLKWYIRMKIGSISTLLLSTIIVSVLLKLTLTYKISLGMFMSLVNSIFSLIQSMSWDLTSLIDANTRHIEFFKELFKFMSLEEVEDIGCDPDISSITFEKLEFKNVSFTYPGTDKQILKNVSFVINDKNSYAFVGKNGAGKSTIVKLIIGLYDEYEGEILINNHSIEKLTTGQRKTLVSIVFQDFARYPISAYDNIVIGNLKERENIKERVEEAINVTNLKETLDRLPKGINTLLGKVKKNSVDISGGEWQKIAFSRAIIQEAPIRILDEPTSAIDPIAEVELYNQFENLSLGKTTILISHRLASIKYVNCIFVIDDCKVIEQGTHEELISLEGKYKEMYTSQSKWYERESVK